MYDTIIKKGNSYLQHGFHNNRIYLMHLDKRDMPEILDTLTYMANTHGYTKKIAKVPETYSPFFLERGYTTEAKVPGFFNGKEDCVFMGKYRDKERNIPVNKLLNKKVLEAAHSKTPVDSLEFKSTDYKLPSGFYFKKAESIDVYKMCELYSKVFNSYPFPVSDPEYIQQTMNNHVVYFSIWKDNEIIALSSCEINTEDENVEMTDFAILPEYRGYNLAYFLLIKMEKEMKENKIKTAYTIARSCSYAMNCTFAKCGYDFSGVLIKNTQIGGKIEDMNIWYKSLV
ncbi:MAG: putative beta-lysine N-acetyltransferase [Tissierella sp.]|uniref:putative beta-lysine N-acetyltransferase n=1 Tax=Tissierella sp. TaxID=41274 RepID=UPI003F9D5989